MAPLVSAAYYGNYTNMTFNITPSMGTQTAYQMKFILSNSSSVSGYYAPDNIVYTNGTTLPTWVDVAFFDINGVAKPFWIENNTQTSHNATAWVLLDSIAVDNSSKGSWGFGNASQSASTMDGLNTFPLWDDFLGASLNTTLWTKSADGTATQSTSILDIASATVVPCRIYSSNTFDINYTIRANGIIPPSGVDKHVRFVGFGTVSYDKYAQWAHGTPIGDGYVGSRTYKTAESTVNRLLLSDGAYHLYDIKRNGSSSVVYSLDSIDYAPETSQVPSGVINTIIQSGPPADTAVVVHSYYNWIFVRKSVETEPTTSLYTTTASTIITPISSNFTASPNPSTVGNPVTLTDTSTGSPTTWNWTIDGAITNTTQNVEYIFSTTGTYSIDLNVTNSTGHFSNITKTQTVVNASGWNQQDLTQVGQYITTFTITDSSTGAAIPVVVITSSGGQSNTTTIGTGSLTYPPGVYVAYLASTGYDGKSVSFIVDGDSTIAVQLVKSTVSNNPSIVYIPQQVRFQLVDMNGYFMSGVFVQATPINFTAPDNWTQTLLGITPSVGIRNTTVYGTTASDGSWAAPMLQSFQYQINMTRDSDVNYNFTLYPTSLDYKFMIPTGAFVPITTPSNVVAYSLENATIDSTHQFVNMSYNDGSLNTDYLAFNIYDLNRTLLQSTNYTGATANAQNFSVILTCPKGQSFTYGFQANQSAYGWINQSSTITIMSQIELLPNGPAWITQWVAIALIVVFGCLFMIYSKAYALIGIPLLTWAFQYILLWLPATFMSLIALGCMLTVGVLVYIRQAENKIQ